MDCGRLERWRRPTTLLTQQPSGSFTNLSEEQRIDVTVVGDILPQLVHAQIVAVD